MALDAPLTEKLRAHGDNQRVADPAIAAAYDAFVRRLKQSDAIASAPGIGDLLPPFALPDAQGHITSSADFLRSGPLVVSFNRGAWCSYCMLELTALADAFSEIRKAGAAIVSVMPDRARQTKEICAALSLPFPILTDIDNGYALASGLMVSLDPDIRANMQKAGINLETIQGNTAGFLPVPATYVVDRDSKVIGGGVDADFRRRVPTGSILEALGVT